MEGMEERVWVPVMATMAVVLHLPPLLLLRNLKAEESLLGHGLLSIKLKSKRRHPQTILPVLQHVATLFPRTPRRQQAEVALPNVPRFPLPSYALSPKAHLQYLPLVPSQDVTLSMRQVPLVRRSLQNQLISQSEARLNLQPNPTLPVQGRLR